jgi:hypothetical protein
MENTAELDWADLETEEMKKHVDDLPAIEIVPVRDDGDKANLVDIVKVFQKHYLEAKKQFLEAKRENEKLLRENGKLLLRISSMRSRRYVATLGELLDRLTITQIKEVKIPDHKKEYAQEIKDILHDIDLILKDSAVVFNADMLRALVVLAQYNLHIWMNEANFRKGVREGNNLELTHGLNSIRNFSKNLIQGIIGGRKDYKLDSVKAFPEWVPSGYQADE